jgi:mitochondrial import inner membrane translocase subunit TIM16
MAIGPLARMLAQIVVPVVAVLARALPAAYAQALNNARRSGAAAASETAASQNILRPNRISTGEALSVLNFATEDEARTSLARIEEQYEKYMRANAVNATGGGSFYLQSKIYRAREQLLREFHEEKQQQQQQQQQPAQNSNNGAENQNKS